MWEPDTRTLFLILFLVNAVLTLMLLPFWKTQKTYDGFRAWMISLLLISCGYFLYLLRDSVSDLLSIVVANVLIMLSVLVRLDAIRRFLWSRPLPTPVYMTLVPFTALVLYYTYVVDSEVLRTLVSDVIIVPGLLATAFVALLYEEKESRPMRSAFSITILVVSTFLIVRIFYWLVTPGDHSVLSTDTPNSIFFIVTIITDILATGFFLMLNMVRSQSELRASEERYRDLADNLPDYVVVHNGRNIRYVNPPAALLMGMLPESLAGRSISEVFAPASAEAVLVSVNAAMRGEPRTGPGEIDIQLMDGTVRHCMIKSSKMTFRGEPAFISVITDITERKSAELALSLAIKKLTILSSVTRHDIKNQLLALSGYLALSREKPANVPAVSGFLEKCIRIADTIGRQIDFTRIYEDLGTTAPAWLNINASVSRAVASLPVGNIRVLVDRTDVEIYADPLAEKVFYNLIDNALRYGGGKMTEIRFSSSEAGSGRVITCEDDGEGIAPEDKKRLFERGYGKNTGLGLFLSREILSITGISIAETSEPGSGARFEMAVPKGKYRSDAKV